MTELRQLEGRDRKLVQRSRLVAGGDVPEIVGLEDARVQIVERLFELREPDRVAVQHFEIELVVDDQIMERATERAGRASGDILQPDMLRERTACNFPHAGPEIGHLGNPHLERFRQKAPERRRSLCHGEGVQLSGSEVSGNGPPGLEKACGRLDGRLSERAERGSLYGTAEPAEREGVIDFAGPVRFEESGARKDRGEIRSVCRRGGRLGRGKAAGKLGHVARLEWLRHAVQGALSDLVRLHVMSPHRKLAGLGRSSSGTAGERRGSAQSSPGSNRAGCWPPGGFRPRRS